MPRFRLSHCQLQLIQVKTEAAASVENFQVIVCFDTPSAEQRAAAATAGLRILTFRDLMNIVWIRLEQCLIERVTASAGSRKCARMHCPLT